MKKKLTKEILDKIIKEEKEKIINKSKSQLIDETLELGTDSPERVKAEEVDADEYQDTLSKHVDFVRALKLEENRLFKRLETIQEMKKTVISKISKEIE